MLSILSANVTLNLHILKHFNTESICTFSTVKNKTVMFPILSEQEFMRYILFQKFVNKIDIFCYSVKYPTKGIYSIFIHNSNSAIHAKSDKIGLVINSSTVRITFKLFTYPPYK